MTDPRIERISDRQAIAELLAEYCRALDLMDLDAIAGVFTADCRVEYGPEARLTSHGAAGVAKSLERMWRWARTSHHLSNIQIEFESADGARAVSYVIAWHERPDGSTATVLGQYHDRLQRRDEGWRIAERRMLMNGNTAGFTVNLFRTPRRPAPEGWVAPNIDRPVEDKA
jgi:ketosteroid isomerase-like protein